MFFENAPNDRKAQARSSLGVDRVFDPVEALEDALLVGLADPTAAVGDFDAQPGQG